MTLYSKGKRATTYAVVRLGYGGKAVKGAIPNDLPLIGDILELNLSAVNSAIDGTPGYFEPEEEKTYYYQGFRALLPLSREFSVEYPDYAITTATQEKIL
jgi:hypothetical protein